MNEVYSTISQFNMESRKDFYTYDIHILHERRLLDVAETSALIIAI